MEGKTEEEVERYAKVFKERYKELNGMLQPIWVWLWNRLLLYIWTWNQNTLLNPDQCASINLQLNFSKLKLLVSYIQQLAWFLFINRSLKLVSHQNVKVLPNLFNLNRFLQIMIELSKTSRGGRLEFLGRMRSWKLSERNWTATRILG